jgi:hypothetical protein
MTEENKEVSNCIMKDSFSVVIISVNVALIVENVKNYHHKKIFFIILNILFSNGKNKMSAEITTCTTFIFIAYAGFLSLM